MDLGWFRRCARPAALIAALCFGAIACQAAALAPDQLRVPKGFQVELLTDAVPNARAMALGRYADGAGVVYVGSMRAGKVYAVSFGNGSPTRVQTVASGLDLPAGVAYREGRLYVSAVSRLLRFDGIDGLRDNPLAPAVVTDRLPAETHHGAKFIAFGPDGHLYYAVGAPCNVCVPDDGHANIQRIDFGTGKTEIVARGVRNSVGFDWNPIDRSLWFTDNGRDLLGDDVPSDELNRVQAPGQHFGFPYCHQGDLGDPEFGHGTVCKNYVAPVAKLGAHVAALGMRFYAADQFPLEYRGNVFIAEHGSWNRSRKSGYQVVRVVLDRQGQVLRHESFVQGWLKSDAGGRESVLGRPADVLVLPDGSLLISDDLGGAIYRVRYAR